ncbi:hypothetical protein AX17_002249 [Amanita inopinata Kibby_2008]|nr:hypothetical protein AX17_002249 [Amanita inopinata Kibby_2008]
MDKLTSVIAAFDAGKLPTTQQANQLIDWLNNVGIAQMEPSGADELSSQGRLLASDIRSVLECYKEIGNNKNRDNILQEAIWHLAQGELVTTAKTATDVDKAKQDLDAIRNALRTILTVIWNSFMTEGTSLLQDFISFTRLALADTAEVIEETAGRTKESLREQEKGFQGGERDVWGRDKERLEEERDVKVAWEHSMDTVKGAGASVIETSQSIKGSTEEKTERTRSRLRNAYSQIFDRAQSDPSFKASLDTVFAIIRERLNQTMDIAADSDTTLQSFINDPTPEQHIPKSLNLLRTLLEHLSNRSLEPFLDRLRACVVSITHDEQLRQWFSDFFELSQKTLGEPGFAGSEESSKTREELSARWKKLLDEDTQWKSDVEGLQKELDDIQTGLNSDKDLVRLKMAHNKLSKDLQLGLLDVSTAAQTGMEAAVEQATWFWQDIFKVYIPRFLEMLKNVPIPRTEYKDAEIEFVLENLDISSFHVLPSHVYLRNITDIDITASASPDVPSRTAVGTLTSIRIQALQMALDDVSFWYRDKTATIGLTEFTGLMAVALPEKGIDVDLKIRLIPTITKGLQSRESLKHFHIVEKAEVKISDELELEVKESDHPIIMTVFKPLILMRLRKALEKALTEQLRAIIDWIDGIAFDVGKRREVFEDTGIDGGSALMAALWSEIGRLQRERTFGESEMGFRATGTGVIVERFAVGEGGEKEKQASFAMGAEPQILSGTKQGPLGTGSESLGKRMEGVVSSAEGAMGVSFESAMQEGPGQAKEKGKRMLKAGRQKVQSFRRSIEIKATEEKQVEGWKSSAFDIVA